MNIQIKASHIICLFIAIIAATVIGILFPQWMHQLGSNVLSFLDMYRGQIYLLFIVIGLIFVSSMITNLR